MGPAKKATKSPKNTNKNTLDKFFRPPSLSTAKKRKSIAVTNDDVIIIDSDSDVEVLASNKAAIGSGKAKKRRLSITSSDIEFLDDRPQRVKDNTAEPIPLVQGAPSFGAPYLLLSSQPDDLTLAPPTTEDPHHLVASSSKQTLDMMDEPVSFDDVPGQCSPKTEPVESLDLGGDEWAMGDDEQMETQEDDEYLEENPAAPNESVCPLCQKTFTDITEADFSIHVNACLDDLSAPGHTPPKLKKSQSLPTPPFDQRALRPLSSMQPPRTSEPSTHEAGPQKSNAFSVLMSSHKENEAWKEADVAEDPRIRPTKANGGRRKAPFYKVMQGMPIAVDAFKYGAIPGVTAYFLTHAHSDHYTNLSSTWDSGPIYCSQGTANLVMHMLKVDAKWVRPLPMDTPSAIPDTDGVTVTLIEANHCPGSSLFFFEGRQTVNAGDSTIHSHFVGSPKIFRYLHCGDFRASPQHVLHPNVVGKKIDLVYLDTTYLDPKYTFPPQPMVITACADLAKRIAEGQDIGSPEQSMKSFFTDTKTSTSPKKNDGKRTLMIVGTYSIGKERIVKAIAKSLGTKVYCDSRKAAILRCQDDAELHDMLTTKPLEARVHIVPLGLITSDKLKEYVGKYKGHFTRAIGFRPTGWTYSPPKGTDFNPSMATIVNRAQKNDFTYKDLHASRGSTASLQLYPVPYSEHSSFFELTCFALSLDWAKMIATVNVGSESSRVKMGKWFQRWEAEKKTQGPRFVLKHRSANYW